MDSNLLVLIFSLCIKQTFSAKDGRFQLHIIPEKEKQAIGIYCNYSLTNIFLLCRHITALWIINCSNNYKKRTDIVTVKSNSSATGGLAMYP